MYSAEPYGALDTLLEVWIPIRTGCDEKLLSSRDRESPFVTVYQKNAQEPIVAIDRFKVFSSLKEHIYLGSHAVSVFTLTLLVK